MKHLLLLLVRTFAIMIGGELNETLMSNCCAAEKVMYILSIMNRSDTNYVVTIPHMFLDHFIDCSCNF